MKGGRDVIRWIVAAGSLSFGLVLLPLVLVSPAVAGAAEFHIVPGSVHVAALDAEGNPDTRAGVHPNRFQTTFQFDSAGSGTSARDFVFEFDPGLGGNPSATPTCPRPIFESESCPANTQVGVFKLDLGENEPFDEPIYNVAPAPNQIAVFGFKPFWKTQLEMDVRPTDYGLRLRTSELPQLPLDAGQVELWGIPADHMAEPPAERIPFLTTPTRCGPLKVTFRVRSWAVGAPWQSEVAETPPFTGCESLPFAPTLSFDLDNRTADSPTGAQVDLSVPKRDGPDESVNSQIKDVRVDLPPGVTISPGGAEGLEPCTDSQFGLGREAPIACPPLSRVGSAVISSPELDEALSGSVYLGEEHPGERFRLFVGAAARGVELKSLGKLVINPQTGQLAAVLGDLPQVALDHLSLHFDGGPQALLATPLSCGPATAKGHFVPYSGSAAVDTSAVVDIAGLSGSACPTPLPFSPGLTAGSTQAKAGGQTGFQMILSRKDGEQLPKRFAVTLPSGLDPYLGEVEPCQSAAAAAGACGAASRIGSAAAEIGSGTSLALVHGDVYLTESYRGAPFGVSVVFRASVGPFDLGNLDVRGALKLDRQTGQVTIQTDPLPSVFEGIPMRFRTISMDLDRRGLLSNPTSCAKQKVVASIDSVDGRTASVAIPFTVRGCDTLAFRPKFSSTLTDRTELHDGGHPGVRFAVRIPRGGANLRRFRMKLPDLLAFRAAGLRAICARGDAEEGACPAAARVGTGFARTPLLKRSLRGPIYLVQPKGRGLPGLWTRISAQGFEVNVAGETFRRGGHLVTEIRDLPDMPLSRFTMSLDGGKGGPFSLKGGLCRSGHARSLFSPTEAEAQNGAYLLARMPLATPARCGGGRNRSPSSARGSAR